MEGSAAMAGVRLLALRGAPNVSCCPHSGLAQRARWGCMCAWGQGGGGALQEPLEEAGTALRSCNLKYSPPAACNTIEEGLGYAGPPSLCFLHSTQAFITASLESSAGAGGIPFEGSLCARTNTINLNMAPTNKKHSFLDPCLDSGRDSCCAGD